MQGIAEFLPVFEIGLSVLEQRIRREKEQGRTIAIYFSNAQRGDLPSRDEILIGRGLVSAPTPESLGICLNNKGALSALGFNGRISSITDLVMAAPSPILDGWRQVIGGDTSPERFFSRFSLGVEDASPDSCFGLFCFLLRLSGIAPDRVPAEWIDYIRRWEDGDIVIADTPYMAYGCLHNSLVHRSIETNIGNSWIEGLKLLRSVLRAPCSPVAIPIQLDSPELKLARAFLAYEEQAYEESLRHTPPIQLSVPLAGTTNRLRLVDAYLGEEMIPIGSLKAFARTDRRRPFLKNGFAIMGIYRPIAEGHGNDFTISADPNAGIELTRVWKRLEELEDLHWAGERPCDKPRDNMVVYEGGKRSDGTPAPNEPWYLHKDRTLIGAPNWLGPHGPPGTRLSWADVREALWETSHPFRDVNVRAGAMAATLDRSLTVAELRPLDQCFPEDLPQSFAEQCPTGDRRLLIAGWHSRSNADPALRVTPTLGRYLAALVDRAPTSTAPVRLADLPDEGAYDLLELPGGVAVVTDHGAFIIDADRHPHLPIAELKAEFCRARDIFHKLEHGVGRISALLSDTQAYIDGERKDLTDRGLLHLLAGEQVEVALDLHRARSGQAPPQAGQFREALLKRWGIDGRLESLASAVEQIRELLQSHSELISGRRFAFLQTYGLPLVASAALFGFVFSNLNPKLTWPPNLSGVNWQGFVLFFIVAAFGALSIRLFSWFGDGLRRRMGKRALLDRRRQSRSS